MDDKTLPCENFKNFPCEKCEDFGTCYIFEKHKKQLINAYSNKENDLANIDCEECIKARSCGMFRLLDSELRYSMKKDNFKKLCECVSYICVYSESQRRK